jgi:hypothetical protein
LRLNEIKERPPSISLLARRMKSQGPTADAEGERFSEDSSSVMSSPPKQTRRGSAGVLHIPTTGRRNKAIVSSLARRAHQSAQDSNAAPKSTVYSHFSIDHSDDSSYYRLTDRKRFSVSLMEHQHTFFCERKVLTSSISDVWKLVISAYENVLIRFIYTGTCLHSGREAARARNSDG